MSKVGRILGRLGASMLRFLLNTLVVTVSGKCFGSAWECFGQLANMVLQRSINLPRFGRAVARR